MADERFKRWGGGCERSGESEGGREVGGWTRAGWLKKWKGRDAETEERGFGREM